MEEAAAAARGMPLLRRREVSRALGGGRLGACVCLGSRRVLTWVWLGLCSLSPRLVAGGGGGGGTEDGMYTELWNLCAGPLVTVPRVGDKVYYFPQGHIEQVS